MPRSSFVCLTRKRRVADNALVCFPYAGAGTVPFRAWARQAGEELSVWSLRLPGREDLVRSPHCTNWPSLIADLLPELPVAPRMTFFGHCLGALLAFEVTRALHEYGRPGPARLIVIGDAPGDAKGPPVPDDLSEELRGTGLVTDEVLADPSIMAVIEPVIRADLQLAAGYPFRDAGRVTVPVDVLAEHGKPETAATHLRGWSAVTEADASLHLIRGGPLYPHGAWQEVGASVLRLAAADRPVEEGEDS